MEPVVLNNIIIGLDAVPTYDGLSSVEEFLAVIEETALLANWTEVQKVAITKLKLKNQAKQFIDAEADLKIKPSWDALSKALKTQFIRPEINGEARRKYMECKQRNGETCRQFLTRLKVLANKTITYSGTAAVDDILKQRFEEELTTQFIMGFRMPMKARILSKAPTNLKAALEMAEREEAIDSIIRPSVSHTECRGLNLGTTSKCYNCQKSGHIARDCRQQKPREVKCFKCNKEGHFANSCRTQEVETREYRQANTRELKCFKCNQIGHYASSCRAQNSRELRTCYGCNKVGHLRHNCPDKPPRAMNYQGGLNANAAT